jgi:hypothetical protein
MVPMKTNVSEFPKHPLPHIPQPQPQRPRVQPPTVYVYEKQGWEHKVLSSTSAYEPPLTEDELNALGKNGWELVAVVPLPNRIQFYMKRART